ncbi:MAG TPA: histidine kinase [Bacteroidia bacterium]|nr:histidine kinase [Bacteroidia bacterium]
MKKPLSQSEELALRRRKLFAVVYVITVTGFWFAYTRNTIQGIDGFLRIVLYAGTYVAAVAISIYFWFEKYLLKKKFARFLSLTSLIFFCDYWLQQLVLGPPWNISNDIAKEGIHVLLIDLFLNQLIHYFFCAIAVSFMLTEVWFKNSARISELEKTNYKAELDLLKRHISPHFFFNTFNNLYVLSKTDSSRTSQTILELSDLMRYQLYEAQKEKVSLRKEMTYIENLLALEKIRKDNIIIEVKTTGNYGDVEIEPLLLSALVENAIKHGSQKTEQSEIFIDLTIADHELLFKVKNNFKKDVCNGNGKAGGGTGLPNLKRRLELLYPECYSLNTTADENYFIAELKLGK